MNWAHHMLGKPCPDPQCREDVGMDDDHVAPDALNGGEDNAPRRAGRKPGKIARGNCPKCGRDTALKGDGTNFKHQQQLPDGRIGMGTCWPSKR